MKPRYMRIAAVLAALLFNLQLWAQNPNNPIQLGLLRWYQANSSAQFAACTGTNSEGLAFDGAHMWVACNQANEIQEFNTSDGTLMRTITGITAAYGLVYDGANIWVTNATTPGTITKVQASTGTVLGTFVVGNNPAEMAFDGTYVWVGNFCNCGFGGNSISRVLATTGAVTTYNLSTCTEPGGVVFDGSHLWVTCGYQGTVLKLNLTGGVLATVTVGSNPFGMAFDGTNLWVANSSAGSVSRINTNTLTVTTITVASPVWTLFDGKYVWVSNNVAGTVTKLLASTGAVVGTFPAGTDPSFLGFDGGNVWVSASNSSGGTISKM